MTTDLKLYSERDDNLEHFRHYHGSGGNVPVGWLARHTSVAHHKSESRILQNQRRQRASLPKCGTAQTEFKVQRTKGGTDVSLLQAGTRSAEGRRTENSEALQADKLQQAPKYNDGNHHTHRT